MSLAAVAAVCAAAVPASAGRTAPAAEAPHLTAKVTVPSRTAGDDITGPVRRAELAQQITRARWVPEPEIYTVRAGDSLSVIAGRVYGKQAAWPVLYWSNRGTIRWANQIITGQVLHVPAEPAKIPAAPRQLEPAPPPPPPAPTSTVTAASYQPARSAPASSSYSGGTPGGSFGACVVARESGGNSQVMNSSGHYGLYQFSEPTWVAYGGPAADFGHASAAEQNRVFANAIARGGQSNWSLYDGC